MSSITNFLPLSKGKNAIFRAVVKGVPTPEVKWRRAKGEMDDPGKYEIFFNKVINEYVLKVKIKYCGQDTQSREHNEKGKPAVGYQGGNISI